MNYLISLEETNRDLEEKINKLEQELSQRQVNGNLKNPYEDVQNFGFSRQHFPQAPTSWRAATTVDNMNQPNGLSRQTNSTNKFNYSSFRRSVTPVAFNDNLFSMTFQPEFSPNFVCQSLTGTQSTPPTSRLLYYTPPRHEIYFQNESVNHNLPPNRQNHLSIKANQLKSASFSELRHSRMVRADNNCLKLPANVVQDAQNNLCAKSSAVSGQNYHFFENFYANTKTSAMHNICQLPPQYASSYHQRTYTTPCTRSTLPQLYAQGNDFVNGKLSSINCWSNERVNLFNPLAFCGSPISTRCSDAQNVYSNANRGQLLSSNITIRSDDTV
ncbi:unnamed protein product [Heterobilharzia americana]|nr:unnamed protein product [Heterobilharzia americana]